MKSNVSFLRRLGAVVYDAFLVFSLVFFVMGVIIIALFKNQAQISELLFLHRYSARYLLLFFTFLGKRTTNLRHESLEISGDSSKWREYYSKTGFDSIYLCNHWYCFFISMV